MTKTKTDIRETIETFLESWDRHVWMQEHGEWASEDWNDERAEHTESHNELVSAVAAVTTALDAVPEAVRLVNGSGAYAETRAALEAALEALAAAETTATALESQVRPDEQDYIAEGEIDPDGVESEAEACDVGSSWQGWDCKEGWHAHRVGSALYLRWWRDAYGGSNRHERDLWVCVDKDYFEEESEAEDAA